MGQDKEISEGEDKLYEHFNVVVDAGQTPLRIDKFLMSKIQNVTRNKLQNSIKTGLVKVNEKLVKSNYKIRPLDHIIIVLPTPPNTHDLLAEDIPIDIIYEDDYLLIVNKEAGMVVHPGHNNYTGTLVNALAHHFENLPNMESKRPGLVHRIDKNTTGLLVVAKDEFTHAALAAQFFDHSTHRRYIAMVWGEPEKENDTIIGNLARDPKDRRRSKVFTDDEIGKHAITHYKTLEKFMFATMVECQLETGRTHQIRAHFKYIGHPLFADDMYGGMEIRKGANLPKFKQFMDNNFKLMPRQALHAAELGFIHPNTKEKMLFKQALPKDFKTVLERFRVYAKNF